MNNLITRNRTLTMSLAFAGIFAVTNLAVAQQTTEEIIVRAPKERVFDVTTVGSLVKVEYAEVNQYVSISDLDLSRSADVEELDIRIETVAKESCQKLSDMYPFDRLDALLMNTCVDRAVRSAGKQRTSAISVGH